MNTSYPNQKPGLLIAIIWMTLVSGIINLFWGFVASATALGTIIGVICLPITILPTILGIFEIIYAAKLLSTQPEPIKPSQSIAVFQILTAFLGNAFSMVVGILALIFYNDKSVRDYFSKLNGVQITTPDPMPTPPANIDPEPLPEISPAEPAVSEIPALETEAVPPVKPKRTRKVTGK